jgi:hypothetical protein
MTDDEETTEDACDHRDGSENKKYGEQKPPWSRDEGNWDDKHSEGCCEVERQCRD